jgi:protein DGCR14
VLDEDTYTDLLSHIIARDYFPGLLEIQAQQDYLDALDLNDPDWIASAGRKLTELMQPGEDGRRVRGRRGTSMTPMVNHTGRKGNETPSVWGGAETPVSVAGTDTGSSFGDGESKPEVDLNISLSKFQAKYTSEDNESFNKLLDRENARRAEKYAWAYNGNKILAARQVLHREREAAKQLEAADAAKLALKDGDSSISTALTTTHRPPTSLDSRPAQPTSAPNRPKNSLMFAPDSVEDTHLTAAARADAASMAPPRTVIHANTRLPAPAPERPDVPPSPSLSAIRDAINGRPRPTDSEPGYSGAETPRVAGYAFVDMEPEPEPPVPRSLLQMFGEHGDGKNGFRLSDIARREKLHGKMVERLGKGKKGDGGLGGIGGVVGGETPRFMSAPGKSRANLTPAAQRLFQRVGTPRREGSGAFGGGLGNGGGEVRGNRWTPTPKVKRRA